MYLLDDARLRRYTFQSIFNTIVKEKDLWWFRFPLEKPQIVRQWNHNCERAKNLARHIFRKTSPPRL